MEKQSELARPLISLSDPDEAIYNLRSVRVLQTVSNEAVIRKSNLISRVLLFQGSVTIGE